MGKVLPSARISGRQFADDFKTNNQATSPSISETSATETRRAIGGAAILTATISNNNAFLKFAESHLIIRAFSGNNNAKTQKLHLYFLRKIN
ncbi:MAG: hypothetical protein J5789_00095 [Oscillospiraceae bacterium]|nr:hypothetical protein [Oscillospiraceae bacterium]